MIDIDIYRVPAHPGKSWKVIEFKKGIFRACKVTENNCGHVKSWKNHGISPIGHGIFNRRIIILGVLLGL